MDTIPLLIEDEPPYGKYTCDGVLGSQLNYIRKLLKSKNGGHGCEKIFA